MKAGLLLRIGIHLLGIWALFTALTTGYHSLHLLVTTDTGAGWQSATYLWGSVYSQLVFPVLFALCAFTCAGRIERLLLGADGGVPVAVDAFAPNGMFAIGCRILGLYLMATYGPWMIATIYEMVTISAGSAAFSEAEVTSDAIGNLLGIVAGLTLARKTDWVLRWCGVVAGAPDLTTRP